MAGHSSDARAADAAPIHPFHLSKGAHVADRPRALVTAPFRGEGMDTLQSLVDVVYDPWIEQVPLRLYNGEKLAARIEAEGANLLIVESDSVKGPVFDLPLIS